MSIFFRKPEKRAIETLPWNYGGPLQSTVSQERALHLGPVFSANRHITDGVSTLPLKSYRKTGESRLPTPMPPIFADLQSSGRLIPWLAQAVSSVVLRGNAVGLIVSANRLGFPAQVEWLPMERVGVDETVPGAPEWYIDGRRVSRTDIVHVPWIVPAGKTLGLSPIEHFAATVNAGLGAQAFGSEWFDNGGVPPGTFKSSRATFDGETAEKISDRLVAAIRRRRPLVYGSDWEYNPISIPPEQAQFIETQKLTAGQIAAIYGIDPTEIGGESANSLTYSTEERRQIKNLANLRPWLVRFEAVFNSWLPDSQRVRFNGDAVIRADLKTRWEVHQIRRTIGAENIDGIRAIEDQPPLPDGQGSDYTPLPIAQAEASTPESDSSADEDEGRRLSVIHPPRPAIEGR